MRVPVSASTQRALDRMLDRLVGSRAWIAVVAFALIGIVAAQLWVVKLGAGVGRALEHEALLQRENTALEVEDSTLSSGERVERLAAAQGMVLAPEAALHFDAPRGSLDARRAATALAQPHTQTTTAAPAGAETSAPGSSAAASEAEASATAAVQPAAASTAAPATEVPAAEVPAAEVPAAEVPAAEVPAAEVPAAEVPAAEATSGG